MMMVIEMEVEEIDILLQIKDFILEKASQKMSKFIYSMNTV
jgi:hypothetical protein